MLSSFLPPVNPDHSRPTKAFREEPRLTAMMLNQLFSICFKKHFFPAFVHFYSLFRDRQHTEYLELKKAPESLTIIAA
jgi:hypothetical protein